MTIQVFHDEFDAPVLDTGKWLPFYLPQWSSRAQSAPRYALEHGCLELRVDADQPPWCPEFDGATRCSSLQTGVFAGPVGSTVGQHRFAPACVVREAQTNRATFTPQYGRFELRARAEIGAGNHVALWMIGYEDAPERSAEICVMEIFGSDIGPSGTRVGYGVHPFGDPCIRDEFRRELLPIDAREFHRYAIDWTPSHIDFFVDERFVRRVDQSPAYPMQFMLGIYERPGETPPGTRYPKRFIVDHFRAFGTKS